MDIKFFLKFVALLSTVLLGFDISKEIEEKIIIPQKIIQKAPRLGGKLGGILPQSFPDSMPGYYVMQYECFKDQATFDEVRTRTEFNLNYYSLIREITGIEKDTLHSCQGLLLEVAHPISGATQQEIIDNAKRKYKTELEISRLYNGKTYVDKIKKLP